ncbi:MAG: hypothetical protein BWY72_01246 [Bacteroidetes bacterium ADurb.Bin416]|nr:MAG: hypothetical protein BWY72_01246 [Bacteroidetes bacterium ADurb.Bin416]
MTHKSMDVKIHQIALNQQKVDIIKRDGLSGHFLTERLYSG